MGRTVTCLVWSGLVWLVLQLKRYGPGVSAEADSRLLSSTKPRTLGGRTRHNYCLAVRNTNPSAVLIQVFLFNVI